MVQLGPDYDLAVRLATLEDKVNRLLQNPLGTSFSQTQSDGSLGFELFQDPDTGGTALGFRHGPSSDFSDTSGTTPQHPRFLYIGQLDPSKLPVGATVDRDAGFVLMRADGSPIVLVTNTGGFQVFDKNGVIVFATDEIDGGVAHSVNYPVPTPFFLPGVAAATGAQWMFDSTGTTNEIGGSTFILYNTQLVITTGATGPAGSTWSVQVALANNVLLTDTIDGPTHTASGGLGGAIDTFELPTSWIGQEVSIQVFAATSSAGTPVNIIGNSVVGTGTAAQINTFGLGDVVT